MLLSTGQLFGTTGGGGGVTHPLDGLSPTAAWSLSRNLLSAYGGSRYSDVSGAITQLTDQTGNARNLTDNATVGHRPTLTTAGPNSRACAGFNGSSNFLTSGVAVPLSSFISASTGVMLVSCIINAITLNNGTTYLNDWLLADAGQFAGMFLRNTGGGTAYAYNWDGNDDHATATGVALSTPCVLSWRHESGNIFMGVNGVETSIASGNTQTLTNGITMGGAGVQFATVQVFEAATFSTVPATLSAVISDMRTWIGA